MSANGTRVKVGVREVYSAMSTLVGLSGFLSWTIGLRRCPCDAVREGREEDWTLWEGPPISPDDEAIARHSDSRDEEKHHILYFQRK